MHIFEPMSHLLKQVLFFVCVVLSCVAPASPFVRSFHSAQYSGGHQNNFDFSQDRAGNVYIANGTFLLKYNGVEFSSPVNSMQGRVTSVLCHQGQVFTGGDGDIGVVTEASAGTMRYQSFVDRLPASLRDFQTVWEIFPRENEICFFTNDLIIRKRGNSFSGIFPQKGNTFHKIFFPSPGSIILREQGRGLCRLERGSEVRLLKGGAYFANIKVDYVAARQNALLVGTRENGFFLLDTTLGKVLPIWKELSKEMSNQQLFCGVQLDPQTIALGTRQNGLYIINNEGSIRYHITNNRDLSDNYVTSLFLDRNHLLWVATMDGISMVELNESLHLYDKKYNLPNTINKAVVNDGILYVATDRGIFKADAKQSNPVFEQFALKGVECFDLMWMRKGNKCALLVAGSKGLYAIEEKKTRLLSENYTTVIAGADGNSYTAWVGGVDCLRKIIFENTVIAGENIFHRFDSDLTSEIPEIRSIKQLDNTLFFSVEYAGIYSFDVNDPACKLKKVNLDKLSTLSENHYMLEVFQHQLVFTTQLGLYMLQSEKGKTRVMPLITARELGSSNDSLYSFSVLNIGDSCVFLNCDEGTDHKLYFLRYTNGKWSKNSDAFIRLNKMQKNSMGFHAENKSVLISMNGGLAVYFPALVFHPEKYFENTIRRIMVNGSTCVYGGNYDVPLSPLTSEFFSEGKLVLPYRMNQVDFLYAANSFVNSDNLYFSTFLKPIDRGFTPWNQSAARDFLNLPEGDYTFVVKSKNMYGFKGKTATFSFRILPPWYRTWWAYMIYLSGFAALFYLSLKWNTLRLRQKNIVLERMVDDRTTEIKKQKAHIEEINREITDSINYAKILQTNVLPEPDYFKELLPGGFVFFQPRDIVSGDFYWLSRGPSNSIRLVVADCTGHGVPGAFMSMLGIEKISYVCDQEVLSATPASVLANVNREMKRSLKQEKENSIKDGMEMAYCEFYKDASKLIFSGANRPLLVFREGVLWQNIKGTKTGIGGTTKSDQVFEEHTLELQKGDRVYMFSDGVVDQFGGPEGRKLLTKNFIAMLSGLQTSSIHEQAEKIRSFFAEWMGNEHFQVDDILVIGFEA